MDIFAEVQIGLEPTDDGHQVSLTETREYFINCLKLPSIKELRKITGDHILDCWAGSTDEEF